jgi:hypothetical protein
MHSLNQKHLGRAIVAERIKAAQLRRKTGSKSQHAPPVSSRAPRAEHRPSNAAAARRAAA